MAGKKRKPASDKQPMHRLPLGADAAKQHQAEEASIPSSVSAKILREVLKQQQEEILADSCHQRPSAAAAPVAAPSTSSSLPIPNDDGKENDDDVDEFNGFDAQCEYDSSVVHAAEIDEEDEKALAAFMSKDTSKRPLGDIILQKIREKDAEVATEGRPPVKLDKALLSFIKGLASS